MLDSCYWNSIFTFCWVLNFLVFFVLFSCEFHSLFLTQLCVVYLLYYNSSQIDSFSYLVFASMITYCTSIVLVKNSQFGEHKYEVFFVRNSLFLMQTGLSFDALPIIFWKWSLFCCGCPAYIFVYLKYIFVYLKFFLGFSFEFSLNCNFLSLLSLDSMLCLVNSVLHSSREATGWSCSYQGEVPW